MPDAMDMLESLEVLDLSNIASNILKSKEEVIADLNATQLAAGKRTDGSDILPSYKGLTIHIKQTEKSGLASVTDHVTLFDKGDFYRGLYAEVQGENIEYGSRDEKSEKLNFKYATSKGRLEGLTLDSKDELAESHLRPEWQKEIETQTGLRFS